MQAVNTLKSKMLDKASENPFYGKKHLLALMQESTKSTYIRPHLDKAWGEAKNDKTLREAFFTIFFSIGDISNRQHSIFHGKKTDNGGQSLRKPFMEAMKWLFENVPDQYYAFLERDIFRQFTSLFNVIGTQVKTKKGTKQVTEIINMLEGVDLKKVAKYLATIIRGSNPVERILIAKWLVNARTSKRQKINKKTKKKEGSRDLQDSTRKIMHLRIKLYRALSEEMGWLVQDYKNNCQFTGLKEFRQEYNGELESVLFSVGKIREFDKTQFFAWLDILPSGARFRVRRRLLDGDNKPKGKWLSNYGSIDMGTWFLDWEEFKKNAQQESRALEEKVRQGDNSEETKEKLAQVKKEAKVTTGGETLFSIFDKLTKNTNFSQSEFNTMAHSIMEKTKFEVPVLVIADCSGSMGQDDGLPARMASLATTIAMLKNPSDDLDDVLVTFGDKAEFISGKATGIKKNNRFMEGKTVQINKIVDREADFLTNLNTVGMVTHPRNEGTHFNTVAKAFKQWLDSSENESVIIQRREMIQQYPVFLVMSDGDMNNANTASESMSQFQQDMRQWFGWDGVVVVWNVSVSKTMHTDYFEGLPNVIHYFGFNLGIVNTIFTKIHDLDIIDIYTPIKSLYESNRYDLVRKNVL